MKKILIIALIAFTQFTFAGTIMETLETDLESGEINKSVIYIENNMINMESQGEYSTNIIFNNSKKTITIINHANRTFSTATREDLEKLGKQIESHGDKYSQMMQEQMAMMQEQLKNLPEEQRKYAEQAMQMSASMQQKSEPKIYSKVSASENIQNFKCNKYEAHSDGQLAEIVWTTSAERLGIAKSEVATVQSFFEMIQLLHQSDSFYYEFDSKEAEKLNKYSGIVVQSEEYENGQLILKTKLQKISQANIDDAKFTIPAGYKETNLMDQGF